MGLNRIRVDRYTDPTMPRLQPDRLMSEGSLLLIDGSHSLGGFGSGVPTSGLVPAPANGSLVPNIAAAKLSAITGNTDPTALSSFFNGGYQTTSMQMERSTKGGLHGILSRQNAQGGQGMKLRLPTALAAYLVANRDHSIYHSVWGLVTRAGVHVDGQLDPPLAFIGNLSQPYNNYQSLLDIGGPKGVDLGSQMFPGANVAAQPFLYTTAASRWTGTAPTSATSLLGGIMWGDQEGYVGNTQNRAPSFILYREYIEDLTVSGRLWTTVNDIDSDLFRQSFSLNGKYYADGYSNPATAVP